MKILLAHCFYRSSAPSGEDMVYRREKQLLVDAGHEVVSFERQNDNLKNEGLSDKLRIAVSCIWSRSAQFELEALLQQHRPDVAHFHNTFPQMSLSVYRSCKKHGVPIVQTLHNFRSVCANGLLMRSGRPCEECIQPGCASVRPALRHRCYRDSLSATAPLTLQIALNRKLQMFQQYPARLIALTGFAATKLEQAGFNPNLITVKPNFVSDPIAPDDVHQLQNERQPYALFVGRLSYEKGIHTLINAWREIPELKLRVVGDGELMPRIKTQIAQENLNVELLGLRDNQEVLRQMRHAQFQIIPSECYEGFPAVIAEAFASGTPVLASNIGGLPSLVSEGLTGKLFTPGSAQDLARQVRRLMMSPSLLNQLSLNCRDRYQTLYTPQAAVHQLERIYTSVVTQHATRISLANSPG